MKTVFITGTSSGIGKETAKLFVKKGWNVIATMRNPTKERELTASEHLLILQCDVTNQESIRAAVAEGIKVFGKIDVLVNNAGYYLLGPVEIATHEQIKRQIDTNLLGLIDVTRELIPHFRQQNAGVIINMSSIAGIISIPLQSLYHATKWGVEGFSESLQYELRQFNISVKIIEPGTIKTDFYGRSMTLMQNKKLKEYNSYSSHVIKNINSNGEKGSEAHGVAITIFKAATDHTTKMRYPVGSFKNLIRLRMFLPQTIYRFLIQSTMEK